MFFSDDEWPESDGDPDQDVFDDIMGDDRDPEDYEHDLHYFADDGCPHFPDDCGVFE